MLSGLDLITGESVKQVRRSIKKGQGNYLDTRGKSELLSKSGLPFLGLGKRRLVCHLFRIITTLDRFLELFIQYIMNCDEGTPVEKHASIK